MRRSRSRSTLQRLGDPPAPFRFERMDGRVTAVVSDEDRFERID